HDPSCGLAHPFEGRGGGGSDCCGQQQLHKGDLRLQLGGSKDWHSEPRSLDSSCCTRSCSFALVLTSLQIAKRNCAGLAQLLANWAKSQLHCTSFPNFGSLA